MGWWEDAKSAVLNFPLEETPLAAFQPVGNALIHAAGIPGRLVTGLGHKAAGLDQDMTSKDVIDYALLGDDASIGHLDSYGELLKESVLRDGGPELLAQILGLGGDALADPGLLAGGVSLGKEGIRKAALKASEGPWEQVVSKPFPRRLSPLEMTDEALDPMVGRVTQTSPQAQAEALLERAIDMEDMSGPIRKGWGVKLPEVTSQFPHFTKRGLKRATQMQQHYKAGGVAKTEDALEALRNQKPRGKPKPQLDLAQYVE